MRGCLFTLLLGAIVIGFIVVVGLPAIAAALVTAGLSAAGLNAADTAVTVTSDPPTDLVGLRADRVHVTATGAEVRGMQVGSLDIVLGDVSLLDRTAGAIDGQLDDVTVRGAGGERVSIDRITLGGTMDRVTATAVVPKEEAEALIADAVEAQVGARPTSVTLTAPDGLAVEVAGQVARGTFAVNGTGDLVLRATDGPVADMEIVLIRGGEDLPLELTSVRVTREGALRLAGDLALRLLG